MPFNLKMISYILSIPSLLVPVMPLGGALLHQNGITSANFIEHLLCLGFCAWETVGNKQSSGTVHSSGGE